MVTLRIFPRQLLAAAALLVLCGTGPARAEDDLRQQALALNAITGDDPIEARIEALVKEPDTTKKLLAEASKLAKEKDQPFKYNGAYILARTADGLKDVDKAVQFYRICADHALKLKSGQKMAESFGGLIDILYEHNRFEEVGKICQEFVEIPDNEIVDRLKGAVYQRWVQSLARLGKVDEALKLIDNLVDGKKDNWAILQLKAMVQREAGRYADAAKTYEGILDLIRKDDTLKDKERETLVERVRYLLSGVYIEADDVNKAAGHLQELLKDKPDDPTYNNDLGYIWADHDMNLAEAEKMIRKAMDEDRKRRKNDPDLKPEEDKDVAAYLDSLGWVLFKQKKYDEAKKHLQEAVKIKDGQHIEIFDHLGDVLAALGDKKGAASAWTKGIEAVSKTSKRELERKAAVEKKLAALEKE